MLRRGQDIRERVRGPVSHLLEGLDMGWGAEPC